MAVSNGNANSDRFFPAYPVCTGQSFISGGGRLRPWNFLGNDAEVHTANERSFTTFSLATKSSYKDKRSGEYVSHTEWHRCVVFSKLS